MGHQTSEIPETPKTPSPTKSRRDTQIFSPLPRPPQPQDSGEQQLSFSEPTLRFPRPQGNQNLAHWISSSDPDIMHLTSAPTEDTGLSESTYELIGGTDTESQDGNYTDNISESVGSLEFHRPDDVVSLAGTEHTCDEDSVIDTTEDRHHVTGPVLVALDTQQAAIQDDTDDDDDSSSRASLEYADNSLRTPSILTPEASRYLPRETDKTNFISRWLSRYVTPPHDPLTFIINSALLVLPSILTLLGAVLLIQTLIPVAEYESQPIVSRIASTFSQTSLITATTERHEANTLALSSPTSGVALIPLQESPDEGLFGLRRPTVSFTPHGKNDVLIHVAQDVRDTWLSKNCLNVTVLRSTQHLDFTLSPTADGILVKFPRREAYGVVNLAIRSRCRPKTEKAIKVHFGKGIIVDAFERTKSLAQDLSDLVPVAAHEAERCLAGAKRVFGSASETFSYAWLVGTEKVQDLLINGNMGGTESVTAAASSLWKQTSAAVNDAVVKSGAYDKSVDALRRSQTMLSLGLLDAQVSARMWWLKVQGKDDEYLAYAGKAQAYLQQKKLAAKKLLQKLQPGEKMRG